MKKPLKSVTPTESNNRPVKGSPVVKKDTPAKDAPIKEDAGTDLFGVVKPKPHFVSESDNREELDFELGKYLLRF